MTRAGIVKVEGKRLAGLLGLPGHAIEEVPQWGVEPDGTVDLVVIGPWMPESKPGWRYEEATILEDETISEAIERTWPHGSVNAGAG